MSDRFVFYPVAARTLLGAAVVSWVVGFAVGSWVASPSEVVAQADAHPRIIFTAKPGERPVCATEIVP